MTQILLTERDMEFLRAVYFLEDDGGAVGPARLGRALGVSRVTAMRAMRRLAAHGFGEYRPGLGLILNELGRREVERSIWRHHVVERLMTESLGISCESACDESSRIQFGLSDEFVEMAFEKMGKPANCHCGCAISPPYTPEGLDGCSWCRRLTEGRKGAKKGGGKGRKRR